jgi:hypothetical protein
MDGGLRDWLAGRGQGRAAAKAKQANRLLMSLSAALLVGGAIFFLTAEPGLNIMSAIFAGLTLMVFGTVWSFMPVWAISQGIKSKVNEEIARRLGLTYALSATEVPDFDLVRKLGLISTHFDSKGHSDRWTGRLNGLEIDVSEVTLAQWEEKDNVRTLVTVFNGVILGYPFARAFSGTTTVHSEAALALGSASRQAGLERVGFVDPGFEKVFEVYGSDQVEARYLVHPAFCERLVETEKVFGGANLRMAFINGRVVIVIESRSAFETGGLDAKGDEGRIQRTIMQLESLLRLSATLNERPRT